MRLFKKRDKRTDQQKREDYYKAEIERLQQAAEGKASIRPTRIREDSYQFTGDLNTMPVYGQVYNEDQDRSDLNLTDYQKLQRQCYDIVKINPYAKRVIEMMTDFVIGANLTYTVSEKYRKEIKPVIDAMWTDYDNNFDLYLEGQLNEWWTLGEQIYPVVVQAVDKVANFGIVDPRRVQKIVRDPDNGKRMAQIVMEPDNMGKQKVYGVIHEINEAETDTMRRLGVPQAYKTSREPGYSYAGDVFLFQVNRFPTQTRGYSEIATMSETLDLLDQFIFEVAERSLLLFQFLFDVELEGLDQDAVDAFNVPDPRKNVTFKHNEKVKMTVHSPNLRSVDADTIARLIIRYALAGVGIPEHWIVNGENTNLATAREQNNPIEKRLERKQGVVNNMLKTMIRYQIEQKFPDKSSKEIREIMEAISIDFPSVAGVDRKMRAQVLTETGKSLVVAVSQGWITSEDAANEYIKLGNKFGMDLSTEGAGEHKDGEENKDENDPENLLKQIRNKQPAMPSKDEEQRKADEYVPDRARA